MTEGGIREEEMEKLIAEFINNYERKIEVNMYRFVHFQYEEQ